jgi:low temperature requirement protein LtrA
VESIGLDRIAFAAISLLLATTQYWAYFGIGEDARAEAALDALPADRTQTAGLASYGYAFFVVLFGIVLSAAGLHHALAHPTDPLDWAYSVQLCVGVGVYWVGLGLFRLALGLPDALQRIAGGVVLGAVTIVGATTSGLLALLCLLLGSSTLVLVERRSPASG